MNDDEQKRLKKELEHTFETRAVRSVLVVVTFEDEASRSFVHGDIEELIDATTTVIEMLDDEAPIGDQLITSPRH